MSTWARTHEWYFNRRDYKMIEKVLDSLNEYEWEDLTEEIEAKTGLEVYADMVATEANIDEDEFNDLVHICLKMFKDKYDSLK